jgi:hypothetical protein
MSPHELAELATAADLSEADIEDKASHMASKVQSLAAIWHASGQSEADSLRALRRIARRYRLDLPEHQAYAQALARMANAAWWRQALRRLARIVEQWEIARGAVHKRAAPYISAKGLRRHERNARRLADLLAAMEAVNLDTGETLPLDELVASSQANPAMRRMAMMARIRGVESRARELGHMPWFLTLTAPSRMHAHLVTGQANPKHDGSTPRQVQKYLNGVWRRFKRSADHLELMVYGLRTVEPHHDACPHWHLLVWTRRIDAVPMLRLLRKHALTDTPDEPGAAEHRFTAKRVDPTKGSAAGYVAKYVAKNIDGHGVGEDNESDERGGELARRIVAWARLWGIRQFQFFGLPPITPTRELYRHPGNDLASPALEAVHEAVKANDYAGYLAALGTHSLDLRAQYEARASRRYPDELAQVIRGVLARGGDLSAPRTLTTRTDSWCIQPKPRQVATGPVGGDERAALHAFAPPRTRINNCAPPCESTAYGSTHTSRTSEKGKAWADPRRRQRQSGSRPEAARP